MTTTTEIVAFLLFLAILFGALFCIWFLEDKEERHDGDNGEGK